jgi:hypothetical protein
MLPSSATLVPTELLLHAREEFYFTSSKSPGFQLPSNEAFSRSVHAVLTPDPTGTSKAHPTLSGKKPPSPRKAGVHSH